MYKNRSLGSDMDKVLPTIKKKYILTEEKIRGLMGEGIVLLVSIFNKKVGMLEADSVYIKDELNLSFKEIARLMKRDYRTICRYI